MKTPCDQVISSVNSSLINVIFMNYPTSRQSHSKTTPPQQYFTQLSILPMVTFFFFFFFLKYFYILF